MARMALQILGRKGGQNVLVYGAGRSLDNLHIQRLPRVGTVSIADIMKVRDDAPFIDVNDPGKQRFPVVVASEVIEHFRDPWSDFATLLGLVDPQGLLVCGTNIHDGRPNLERDRYIYYRDHTSYYSVESLRRIATAMGFYVESDGLQTQWLLDPDVDQVELWHDPNGSLETHMSVLADPPPRRNPSKCVGSVTYGGLSDSVVIKRSVSLRWRGRHRLVALAVVAWLHDHCDGPP